MRLISYLLKDFIMLFIISVERITNYKIVEVVKHFTFMQNQRSFAEHCLLLSQAILNLHLVMATGNLMEKP
ncbi:MAG: hypothetical protein EBZ07_08380 [Verrucomicrobia bacterium]|nr:hypothetical protein [Verrucomicrobiota bacterium]